jgi:ribosomal protein S18 acetylase RimI-like enzyme
MRTWLETYRDIFTGDYIRRVVERDYAPMELRRTLERMSDGVELFLVAMDGRELAGYACAVAMVPRYESLRLYVGSRHRRQGIGRALVRQAEMFLTGKGAREYFCYVHSLNVPAQRFYEAMGFEHQPERDMTEPCAFCMRKSIGIASG